MGLELSSVRDIHQIASLKRRAHVSRSRPTYAFVVYPAQVLAVQHVRVPVVFLNLLKQLPRRCEFAADVRSGVHA